MSILSALKMQSNSIDDLAKLPQAMIMQMAQKKQIDKEMLAPILARKAEMMEAVSRSKSLQQPVNQPSVMEQVMAQNIQAENPANTVPQMPQQMPQQMPPQMPPQVMPQQMPAEAGVAQLPIPQRQYAGGGIVAFAKGDLIDLDEDEDDNDILAEYAQAMAAGERAMMMAGPEQGAPVARRMSSYSMPTDNAGVGVRYRDPIPAGASKGMEPNEEGLTRLRAQIMQKESGGRRFDKEGNLLTSSKGALGEMQVMPATARDPGFGIKPARDSSPDELRRVGDEYAGVLLNRYKDPIVAMIAYNMGPGATDKWLAAGADPKKLPKETQGYIRNVTLAKGGEVQRFTNGGSPNISGFEEDFTRFNRAIMPDISKIPDYYRDIKDYFTKPRIKSTDKKRLDEIARGQGVFPEGSPALPGYVLPSVEDPTPQFTFPPQGGVGPTDVELARNAVTQEPQAEKKTKLDEFLEQLSAGRKDLAEQRSQDKNMALLAAGLGMLGGSSRYAAENIGKGGLAGVQFLSEANKQRSAEKAALDKAQVTAMRYQDLGDIAKGNQSGLLNLRQAELSERQRANSLNAVKAMRDDARNVAIAGLKQQGLLGEDLQNPNVAAKIEEQMRIILSNDPAFLQTYRDAFNVDYGKINASPAQSPTIKLDKKGKEIK
jgi:hypothetical protein